MLGVERQVQHRFDQGVHRQDAAHIMTARRSGLVGRRYGIYLCSWLLSWLGCYTILPLLSPIGAREKLHNVRA